jgi:hypothetical protein
VSDPRTLNRAAEQGPRHDAGGRHALQPGKTCGRTTGHGRPLESGLASTS